MAYCFYLSFSSFYHDILCVGTSTYRVEPEQFQIQAEIMKHGPIEVDFFVYEDFLSYKSGEWTKTMLQSLYYISSVKIKWCFMSSIIIKIKWVGLQCCYFVHNSGGATILPVYCQGYNKIIACSLKFCIVLIHTQFCTSQLWKPVNFEFCFIQPAGKFIFSCWKSHGNRTILWIVLGKRDWPRSTVVEWLLVSRNAVVCAVCNHITVVLLHLDCWSVTLVGILK